MNESKSDSTDSSKLSKKDPLPCGKILGGLVLTIALAISIFFLLPPYFESSSGLAHQNRVNQFNKDHTGERIRSFDGDGNDSDDEDDEDELDIIVELDTGEAGKFLGLKEPLVIHEKGQSHYFSFRGIPYSKPPYRWKEPQPPTVKSSPIDATRYKPVCSQWDSASETVIGSQNCLHLNIFTPKLPQSYGNFTLLAPKTLNKIFLPVLVYFHGGDYQKGSGNFLRPQNLMREKGKVLLVTINFRLNVMGFLSGPGDQSELQGNYGLLDQIAALKWIQKNIHNFGGSGKRITIFGDVRLLLFSPLAKPEELFQKAIIMSSPSWSQVQNYDQTRGRLFLDKLLELLNCPLRIDGESEEGPIECLRLKDPEELITKSHTIFKGDQGHLSGFQFGPIVDENLRENPVLPVSPVDILNPESPHVLPQVPILVGVNELEELDLLKEFLKDKDNAQLLNYTGDGDTDAQFKENLFKALFVQKDIFYPYSSAFESIWEFYFTNSDDNDSGSSEDQVISTRKLLELFTDVRIHVPNYLFLQSLIGKSKSPVYNYVFTYRSENADLEHVLTANPESPPWNDINYIADFDEEESEEGETAQDQLVRKIMRQVFASFALFGTPKFGLENLSWSKWERNWQNKEIRYFEINSEPKPMGKDFRLNSTLFWNQVVPNLIKEGDNYRPIISKLSFIWHRPLWMTFIMVLIIVILISFVLFLGFFKIMYFFYSNNNNE